MNVLFVTALAALTLPTVPLLAMDDTRIDCTGTPTDIPLIDTVWWFACMQVSNVCDFFDPCPLDAAPELPVTVDIESRVDLVATSPAQFDCSGTPTDRPLIDGLYQSSCQTVADNCDLFDPCPFDHRAI